MSRNNPQPGPSRGQGRVQVNRPPRVSERVVLMESANASDDCTTNLCICPICFETISEAYVTKCGHSFCFKCIDRTIETLAKCPLCCASLDRQDVFPNYTLNELITKKKTKSVTRQLLGDEGQFDLDEVNRLLELLGQHKLLLETESSVNQSLLLSEFLERLLLQKEEQKSCLEREIKLIQQDLKGVEDIINESRRQSPKSEDASAKGDKLQALRRQMAESTSSGAEQQSQPVASPLLTGSRRRIHMHFDDLSKYYLETRARECHFGADPGTSRAGLDALLNDIAKFSRYERLRKLASLNYSPNFLNHANIVSSIEFDKDNELFALAGVLRRICIYDYNAVVRAAVDIHQPSVEMQLASKISCLSWNAYRKSVLASADYEGAVSIWDVLTGSRSLVFEEHEKRCWSIDFNQIDSKLIASASDDTKVKLWSLDVRNSIGSIEANANVCSVKFNPSSSCHLALGAADHCVHYYDLRNTFRPLHTFKGHKKTVSYVRFINKDELVSTSTDSQLKMWDVNKRDCLRSFVGHVNKKNFVGLAADGDYIACGSEDNKLFMFYKGLPKHIMTYAFSEEAGILDSAKSQNSNDFISAVSWRKGTNVLVAANSQGRVKVLELV